MNNIKNKMMKYWNDESAQGTTEYILVLVVVVALAFVFKERITQIVGDKLGQIGGDIGGFNSK